MRDKILEILKENWHGSYNDCTDDLLDLFSVSTRFTCHSCNEVHSGENDDQLFEVCKECFSK